MARVRTFPVVKDTWTLERKSKQTMGHRMSRKYCAMVEEG